MYQETSHIKVNLVNNSYEVLVGSKIIYSIGQELEKLEIPKGGKVLVITNPDVAQPYSKLFIQSIKDCGYDPRLLILEAGEVQKTTDSIALIHNAAYEHQLDRNSTIIALGGGVIGDMTGFAAATWLRGIGFIQVPTTLLAMVDASVGGKTGVNHPKGKNLIGAFHQPKLVLIDIETLKTLPNREFRAGMAEIIKYGVIGDSDLFLKLEQAADLTRLEAVGQNLIREIIIKSVQTKAKIVEEDEKENGMRAILNYGHTFGHVVETLGGYGKWLHGEAVSIGMVVIGELALQLKLWEKEDFRRQKELIIKAGLPTVWPNFPINKVLRSLQGDKKVKEGRIRFVMPVEIGKVIISSDIKKENLIRLLENMKIANP